MKPSASKPGLAAAPVEGKKKNTLAEIQKLQKDRDERRKAMEQARSDRSAEEKYNAEMGRPGDVDFQRMITKFRQESAPALQHTPPGDLKICVCVRKRPVSVKEVDRKDYDSVTCLNPVVSVHYCKLKVDGISKYLDNFEFEMDHVFSEDDTTDDLYYYAVQPLISFVIGGGRATVFAYGQTGSGKTYTMVGIQRFVADDLFYGLAADTEESEGKRNNPIEVFVTFFEIYGGRCQDLLNNRNKLIVREDGNGEVNITDLLEVPVRSAEDMLEVIDSGNRNRTTHATESNEESSRSHAICQIILKKADSKGRTRMYGKLSLIDLAGSERGADTKSHNRTRRMEGAEINKSLLALKECIRALDSQSTHIPYRASKLTLVLKDSFTRAVARTVMIVNVSPAASSADHTLNTLRYADRIKEKTVGNAARANSEDESRDSRDRSASPKVTPPPPQAARAQAAPKVRSSLDGIASKVAPGGNLLTPPPPAPRQPPPAYPRNSVGAPASKPERRTPTSESEDELLYEDDTLDGDDYDFGQTEEERELNRTIQSLFDEEEELLNLHMNNIQENAELLTEEGKLLQQLQGDDNNDIDVYTSRLDQILDRKLVLIEGLQAKLKLFKQHLLEEEKASKKAADAMRKF